MSDNKRIFYAMHAEARKSACEAVMQAPDGYRITIEPPKRSGEQNARFHALCNDIAGREWAGQPRTAEQWKVLLVSGHAIATKEGAHMVPGLEGEFVNLRESTATMSKRRGSSLIEYAEAFCARNGITLHTHSEAVA